MTVRARSSAPVPAPLVPSSPAVPLLGVVLSVAALCLPVPAPAQGAGSAEDRSLDRAAGTEPTAAVAPGSPPLRFTVPRVEGGFDIDAVMDEPAWEEAPAVGIPFEWTPGDNVPAPVDTECRLAYDDEHLYVGCRAFDPNPGAIRAHFADRDTPFRDDHLVFLFDTFGDQRRAFQFRVNPLGVQMDALFGNGFEDFSWDAIWDSKGRVTEEGYVVEVAIPFKSLSFPSGGAPQTWGVILERSYPRSVRHRMRNVRVNPNDTCLMCQAARMDGLQGMTPGRDLELNPTLTGTRTDERAAAGAPDLETGPVEMDAGLNLQWGISSSLTLDATVNPDFSQVEADVAQLETNRRFALFFPEKRPFFLEGADLFDTPGNLVFTRTVVDPVAGGKFTGKAGPHAIGAFVAVDEVNSLIFPGSQFSRRTFLEDADVTTGVARYRRDVGSSSAVGGLVTVREGAGGYHNRLGAVDARLRVAPSVTLIGQYARSDTDYPDDVAAAFGQPAGAFGGHGAMVGVQRFGRGWFGFARAMAVSDDFRADAGFLPQVGIRGGSVEAHKVFWGNGKRWFSRMSAGVDLDYEEDNGGQVLDRGAELLLNYQGPLQSRVGVELNWLDRFFADRLFSLAQQEMFFAFQPSGAFSFALPITTGTEVDFANRRKADLLRMSPRVEWKAGRRVNLELRHAVERLSLEGEEIFTAHLPQARVLYHLSVEAFLRGIVQYRNVGRNPAMYSDPVPEEGQRLFTQLLFSYKLNPRTVAFVGYSDNSSGFAAGEESVDLARTDRTFFVKLGYAWRP